VPVARDDTDRFRAELAEDLGRMTRVPPRRERPSFEVKRAFGNAPLAERARQGIGLDEIPPAPAATDDDERRKPGTVRFSRSGRTPGGGTAKRWRADAAAE
jgi:hypothetical protein